MAFFVFRLYGNLRIVSMASRAESDAMMRAAIVKFDPFQSANTYRYQ